MIIEVNEDLVGSRIRRLKGVSKKKLKGQQLNADGCFLYDTEIHFVQYFEDIDVFRSIYLGNKSKS